MRPGWEGLEMRRALPAWLFVSLLLPFAGFATPQDEAVPPRPTAAAERAAALTELVAALDRHDYRQALTIDRQWADRFPADLPFRRFEPALFLALGDRAGWEKARTDLLGIWQGMRTRVRPPPNPSITVDMIPAGPDVVVAEQCYERGGRFGVLYRFLVVSPDKRVRSFFTVESTETDNKVARELGSSAPVYTLDHFLPGRHETVAMLQGRPDYVDLRRRVLAYMADPKPLSASGNGQGGLSNEACAVDPM